MKVWPSATAPDRLRVAVDLAGLDQRVSSAFQDVLPVRFVRALSQTMPEVDFVVLARAVNSDALAPLDATNLRRLTIADPGPLAIVLRRLDARLPGRARRARLTRALGQPKRLRGAYSHWRPSVLARLRASVVLCPFTPTTLSDPSVPLVATVADVQHLSHPHLLTSAQRAVRARELDATSRRAQTIVCTANSVRSTLVQHEDLLAKRVLTISPGRLLARPAVAQSKVAAVLARYGCRANRYFLVNADFEPQHNHGLILTAMGIFRARDPQATATVVCVGRPGAPWAALRSAAERMGLVASVQFPEVQNADDHTALIQGCRALLVPSLYDALGESVIDALTLGRPVLSSHLSSMVELMGDAALFFDPHRPDDLAAAFEHVECQPNLLDELALRGRARLTTLADPPSIAQAYLGVLREARTSCPASR